MRLATIADLRRLSEHRDEHCVSILMPTTGVGAEYHKNRIRFKTLLGRAGKVLEERGVSGEDSRELLGQARALEGERPFWKACTRGLAVYSSPGIFLTYRLPFETEERAEVGERFITRPLIRLVAREDRYLLLALGLGDNRLFEATPHSIREIPAENLLGKEGEGFNMSLQTVEWDRSALLTPFVGAAKYMLNACADYAKKREQFGRPIGRFQATKHKLANIRIFYEAAQSLAYKIAWCKDQGRPLNHLEAAVAKLFVGDWSMGPANDAMVLFGGYGYCHEYNMERIFRDSRLAPIGGGTSDIQKMIISKLM